MPVAIEQCPYGHEIRTAADRDAQSHCRACARDRARRRRVSDAMRLSLIRGLEDVGLRFEDDDGRPVTPAEAVRQMVAIIEADAL